MLLWWQEIEYIGKHVFSRCGIYVLYISISAMHNICQMKESDVSQAVYRIGICEATSAYYYYYYYYYYLYIIYVIIILGCAAVPWLA
jgi:hypothetical protein